ncbi:hypothetical protein D3C86_2254300 [compost metagenome]
MGQFAMMGQPFFQAARDLVEFHGFFRIQFQRGNDGRDQGVGLARPYSQGVAWLVA